MARSLEQRITDLEKTVMEFFTGRSKKTSARKSGKKTSKPAGRKTKARKTAKRRSSK